MQNQITVLCDCHNKLNSNCKYRISNNE